MKLSDHPLLVFEAIVIVVAIFLVVTWPSDPITDVKGAVVRSSADQMDVLVTGSNSSNCKVTSISAWVRYQDTWLPASGKLLKLNGDVLLLNERAIKNSPFVRMIRVHPGGSAVSINIVYKCWLPWSYTQRLIVIDTLETPPQIYPIPR